ncbi:MAG: putative lipid II flippase FtsW [Deltaproteobacteria bacterium]|nr:putative lipid II flippase FtsW [Deltaproteobacteria bacterium]
MWNENTIRRAPFDYPLLITVGILTGLGLTMVFSASAVLAQERFGDSLYFLKKALLYSGLGAGVMAGVMRVPYYHWRRLVYPVLLGCFFLGLLTLYSPLGVSLAGARRWLDLGPLTFQFSEAAKIALVIFMAYSMEKKIEKMNIFSIGILPHLLIAGFLILLVLGGKDLGTAFVMASFVLWMLFLGGARLKHLGLLMLAALPFLYYLIAQEGYRMQRVLSFLNPWSDRFGGGFQIIQSFLAFSEGGLFGKGLGAGQQKLFYLPEAHTDFIFSVLAEEMGLVGVFFVVVLFAFLVFRGLQIGRRAPCLFGRYLAFGVAVLIALQSLLNMGVVMGLLPTKGMVLPFVGYGGSSLVCTLVAAGILLNVSTYRAAETPAFFKDRTVDRGPWTVDPVAVP